MAARLRADQDAGLVRADIDPIAIGGGIVSLFMMMLLAAVQFGGDGTLAQSRDVLAVVQAAVDPPA